MHHQKGGINWGDYFRGINIQGDMSTRAVGRQRTRIQDRENPTTAASDDKDCVSVVNVHVSRPIQSLYLNMRAYCVKYEPKHRKKEVKEVFKSKNPGWRSPGFLVKVPRNSVH